MCRVEETSHTMQYGVVLPWMSWQWWSLDGLSLLETLGSDWLTWTAFGIVVALSFGLLSLVVDSLVRRSGCFDYRQQIRLRRLFRIGFGGLLLAATCLPYLFLHVPAATLAFCLVLIVLVVPFLVGERSNRRRHDSNSSTQF